MIRYFRARPRLTFAAMVGCLLFILMPDTWRFTTRLLLSWDFGTGLYLVLAGWVMARANHESIRQRAAMQDDGRLVILCMTTITAMASLAAIVAELATAKGLNGHSEWQHVALAGLTVFLSWTFMQTMFAMHYAHEYYLENNGVLARGLEFPGHEDKPDYWDFIYFSFIIGTAAQTADVNITSDIIRKIATLHCMIVFFFNTTILALTVNIGAGLF